MLSEDTKAWHSKLCDMSEHEIVKLMEGEQIKAYPGISTQCAVAAFVSKKTGDVVAVGSMGMGQPLSAQPVAKDYAYFPHSPELIRFIESFDMGKYPQLVADDYRS